LRMLMTSTSLLSLRLRFIDVCGHLCRSILRLHCRRLIWLLWIPQGLRILPRVTLPHSTTSSSSLNLR
jgi:hypothetical protein